MSGPAPTNWTPAQWQAITATAASILVSAAAGSGKTAVLAERCAHLVCDAVPPCHVDELLVVTFTEVAAAQMKTAIERALRQRHDASPGDARLTRELALIDRAQVSTLHSFCTRLLRQNYHRAGLSADFTILDADEARLLRGEVVKSLFLDRYEDDPAGAFGQFVDSYGQGRDQELMDKVAWTHELLCSLVDSAAWIAAARSRVAATDPASLFLDLVTGFTDRYTQAKRQIRSIDFSDLEIVTLKLLRDGATRDLAPSDFARVVQGQFQHVLVDEYQDINEVQDAILRLVSREALPPPARGNLFCVGDVKQAIYRFRLAEPRRFLERYHRFRQAPAAGRAIDLQSNFRSRAALLAVINDVFSRLMHAGTVDIEYDQSQRLEPGLDYPPAEPNTFAGAPIELHVLGKDADPESDLGRTDREAAVVARRIAELLGRDGRPPMRVAAKNAEGKLAYRTIACRDIVILLRSMQFKADQFARMLRQSGIPAHHDSRTGFFESAEIRDMLALLHVLDNARQDIPLASVLRSPLAAIPEPETLLSRIRLAFPTIPFHEAVFQYAATDDTPAPLRNFLSRLTAWRFLARQRPVAELLWTIYDETNYLAFVSGLADGPQRSANLLYLHQRARQFGSFARQGLFRFLAFLRSLEDQTDLGQPSVLTEADDVVRIMSIHRSKGLEFPVVFLPDLGKAINMDDCRGTILIDRQEGLGLKAVDLPLRIRYPSPAWLQVRDRLRQQTIAEELRVLYVAMTRAREHLILVGTATAAARARWKTHGDVLAAQSMLDWLGPFHESFAVADHASVAAGDLPAGRGAPAVDPSLAALAPMVPAPPGDPRAHFIIDRLTRSYPFESLTKVPAAQAATQWTAHSRGPAGPPLLTTSLSSPLTGADIGTATHLVLEHLDFTKPPTPDALDRQIQRLLDRKFLTQVQADIVDRAAIQWFLETDLGQLIRRKSRVLRREVPFHLAVAPSAEPARSPFDRVMIRGRIDLLIPDGRELVLVDYKTDRLPPDALDERAAHYEAQLRLYREAVEKLSMRPVKAAYLAFLAPRVIRMVS